jgi:membrane protease YdiL (CAAX protease family)
MKRIAVFVSLFLAGLVVFGAGYWGSPIPVPRAVVRLGIPAVLLLSTLWLRRKPGLEAWYRVSLGLLAASVAFAAAWLTSEPLLSLLGAKVDSVRGVALAKLCDALPIVVTVLVVARLGGLEARDLFLQKGRTRVWLTAGLVSFGVLAIVWVFQSRAQGLSAERLASWAPWTLLFVACNGLMEELQFRGLLLGSFERLLGPTAANLCIALFFALVHGPVKYTPNVAAFVAVVFVLALAWGYLIQRSQSLWGAVMFHAGADLLIMAGIYQTYGAG